MIFVGGGIWYMSLLDCHKVPGILLVLYIQYLYDVFVI